MPDTAGEETKQRVNVQGRRQSGAETAANLSRREQQRPHQPQRARVQTELRTAEQRRRNNTAKREQAAVLGGGEQIGGAGLQRNPRSHARRTPRRRLRSSTAKPQRRHERSSNAVMAAGRKRKEQAATCLYALLPCRSARFTAQM